MSDLTTRIGEIASSIEEFKSNYGGRLDHLEKRGARERDNSGSSVGQSLGAQVVKNDAVRALNSQNRGEAVVKLTGDNAAITSANATVGTGRSQGTSVVAADRLTDIIAPYDRDLSVRDLLPQARTISNVIEWPREVSFTNNAAPVAEGAAKPYSDLTFDMASAPVRTLAHMFKASRQILDDADALQAYIDRRGRYGLKRVEEQQLLFGSGTGQNIAGIIPQATAFVPTFTSSNETAIDRINQAASQAEDSDIPVTGIVMNKRDWRRIIGTKDLGGNYISPDSPFALTAPRLWNLPVVATNAIPVGQFLIGGFGDGAQIFDRLDVEVLISTENADDFERNLVSIRIEERIALAVYRPEAFIYGDLFGLIPDDAE